MIKFSLKFHGEPDSLGRRQFELTWTDPGNCNRHEKSNQDDDPVGHRRGQFFFAVAEEHIESLKKRGHEVEIVG